MLVGKSVCQYWFYIFCALFWESKVRWREGQRCTHVHLGWWDKGTELACITAAVLASAWVQSPISQARENQLSE